jgi:hypothetical protein
MPFLQYLRNAASANHFNEQALAGHSVMIPEEFGWR